jgi:hypothetical protein
MSKLKIYQSQMGVKQSQTPNVTSLATPISFYQQLGSNISQAAKQFETIKKDQKTIEDQNRYYEIITEKSKQIDKSLFEASKFTNLDLAEETMAAAYEIDLTGESQGVKNLVNTFINKERIKNNSVLYKAVMSRTAEENNKNDINFLNNNLLQRTNSDPSIRAAGDKEFEVWFNSPVQKTKYSPDKLQKKMDEYEYLKNETLINLGIKNSPLDVLISREEIIEKYGPQKGAMYLRKAENAFLSAAEEELLANDKEVNTRTFNQITLFSELGNRIIDEDNRPTIDELHDLKDAGEINSAQYSALIDLYTNPEKISDQDFINRINNQIVIAESVNELDDIQNVYSSSRDFLENTNIKDTTILSKLIKNFKEDPTKHDDYKNFYRRLRVNLGDMEGVAGLFVGAGGFTTEDKEMTQDALERFNRYVAEDGLTAEEAYVRTISKIGKEKIPDIFSPNLVPLNFDISNMTDAIKKKPDGFFDELNNALAVKFRTGEITRSEFLEDIGRVDLLKDVFEVRRRIGGVEFATAKNEDGGFDFGKLLTEIQKGGK